MKIVIDTEDLYEFVRKTSLLKYKSRRKGLKEGYYIDNWMQGVREYSFISKTREDAIIKLAKEVFSKDGKWEVLKGRLVDTLLRLKKDK